MNKYITLLTATILVTSCAAPKPAPYEIKGTKFYGKNMQQNEEYLSQKSDVSDDFVFKGRLGESTTSNAIDNQGFNPSSSYRSGTSVKDNSIATTKLAPPPRIISDEIDASEQKVPTFHEDYQAPQPTIKARSSDYLDLSSVKSHAAKPSKPLEKEEKAEIGYADERSEKLKNIFPKEKPAIETAAEPKETEQKEVVNITITTPAKSNLEIKTKEEAKIEPKVEPKKEVKKEPKKEEKKEDKKEDKADVKSADLKPAPKEEYINVAPPVPTATTTAAPKKLEVTSEPAKQETAKQDIASIPKIEPVASGSAKFKKPVEGKIIQEFGGSSDGITIQAPEGTPVKASAGGDVVYSGNELKGYGNMIVIKHPNGFLTAYSHLENLNISKGAKVAQGDVIGAVGKTGNVSTPQLHFGVRKGRSAVNPRDYLN